MMYRKILLAPLSWLYGAAVVIRNLLFDGGVLRSKRFNVPVICVGNLAVGGTGKTPHTEYLIRLLRNNYRVAVLSRGYKRRTKGFVLATPDSTARTIGDEPFQMYTKFPDIVPAVDEDRRHGIEQLLALCQPEVILLDDAFQHRYVKPGLSILLTDFHHLFCADALLPAGRLREPKSGRKRADIVIVTKCPTDLSAADYDLIARRLRLLPHQQLFFSTFRYGNLQAVFADAEVPLSSLADTDVLLVTGIASPAPLLKQLKGNARQVDLLSFGDHHDFSDRDMKLIKERFGLLKSERRLIVTTEKDATRLKNHPTLATALKPFVYALPIEVEILREQQDIFNNHIISYVRKNSTDRSFS